MDVPGDDRMTAAVVSFPPRAYASIERLWEAYCAEIARERARTANRVDENPSDGVIS